MEQLINLFCPNIRWIENDEGDSPFITQLRKIMKNSNVENNKLSIRFNVDMYVNDHTMFNFTTGRITGTQRLGYS